MIWKYLGKLFGNRNERLIKSFQPVIDEINGLEDKFAKMSDDELKSYSETLRKSFEGIENIDEQMEKILPEAFALVRETAKRTLGMRHFDVQLIGGIVLHRGSIAEMKTGEGKTLVATLPAYLNGISGSSVHIVTVNDYLARRDAEWMRPVYEFLGLKVGILQNMMDPQKRVEAYKSNIVYGTNSEFGFDYLRDNMVFSANQIVQSPLDYCIIDEVDSILIDEARTPLIISGPSVESTKKYVTIDKFVRRLKKDEDFEIIEKDKNAILKESGIDKMEQWLGVDNLYDPKNFHLVHFITQSLRAHYCFINDVDYLVRNNEVMIVDEFTGRVLEGRRYSDGLHQAIEAKERVHVKEENQTLATITIQNYFRMYKKLAGMTGTALTEAAEFMEIYKLDVVEIPTNELMIRRDYDDLIYKTKKEKYEAIIEEIAKWHEKGRPILVGTTSIEVSEKLSRMLREKKNLHCNVLNAKYHEKEAEIIAKAGEKGSITIATNMAGRGTDIKLGEGVVLCPRIDGKMHCWAKPPDSECKLCDPEKKGCKKEVGCGLYIIGSERHEARRIDNQLRGRAGRQGDPGSTRFFVSLEDDLMRLFGSERVKNMLTTLGLKDGEAIQYSMISKAIEKAQKQVEGHNFDIRKQLLKYDDVNNKQRHYIYNLRRKILLMEDLDNVALDMLKDSVLDAVESKFPKKALPDEWDLEGLRNYLSTIHIESKLIEEDLDTIKPEMIVEEIEKNVESAFNQRKEKLGDDFKYFLRYILLQRLDFYWREHLLAMDQLKDMIGFRGYGQKDPLVEYKRESYEIFEETLNRLEDDVTNIFFNFDINTEEEMENMKVFIESLKEQEGIREKKETYNMMHTGGEKSISREKEKRDRIVRNTSFGKRKRRK